MVPVEDESKKKKNDVSYRAAGVSSTRAHPLRPWLALVGQQPVRPHTHVRTYWRRA